LIVSYSLRLSGFIIPETKNVNFHYSSSCSAPKIDIRPITRPSIRLEIAMVNPKTTPVPTIMKGAIRPTNTAMLIICSMLIPVLLQVDKAKFL